MLKKDLKQGMVVETKRGNKYMLLKDKLMNETGCSFMPLEAYSEDLIINEDLIDNSNDDDNDNGYNIERIYISHAVILNEYFEDKFLELIWERNVKIDWNIVPMDTPVYVKDREDGNWLKRYFKNIGFDEEKRIMFYTWNGGCTSFTGDESTGWKMCKLVRREDVEKYSK